MKSSLGVNEFYDFNKHPSGYGIEILNISMSLLSTKQTPKKCVELDRKHVKRKFNEKKVGGLVLYTDGLYLNSSEESAKLHYRHRQLIEEHKQGFMNHLKKDPTLIPNAYSFISWDQHILNCSKFSSYLAKVRELYKKDRCFKKLVEHDIKAAGREVSRYTIEFILEEILADYAATKGLVELPNEFVQGRQEWVLNIYPGKPIRSQVYLYQLDPLKLGRTSNVYGNCWYDWQQCVLYDFERLDIETFDFS